MPDSSVSLSLSLPIEVLAKTQQLKGLWNGGVPYNSLLVRHHAAFSWWKPEPRYCYMVLF